MSIWEDVAVGIANGELRLLGEQQKKAKVTREQTIHTYAISNGRGAVKLGKAEEPASRIYNLQCGNPDELSLLASWPSTVIDERSAHRACYDSHIRGEWYRLKEWQVKLLPLMKAKLKTGN